MFQIALGITMFPIRTTSGAPSPIPGSSFIATLNDFSRDQTIFDSGAHLQSDPAAASVFISGGSDAPDGETIEWRAVDVENGGAETTVWADAVTLSAGDGSWGASVSLPRTRAWMRLEARVKGSSATAASMTTTCAAGHVWAVWEQSNWARLSLYNSNMGWLIGTVERPNDVQIAQRAGSFTNFDDGVVTPINDATFLSPSMVSFSNAFAQHRPGEKLMVGWHCKGGTSTNDTLTTDAETLADTYSVIGDVRDWNAEYVTHRALIRDGSQVGVLWVAGWIASNGGGGPIATDTMAPTFLCKDASGAAIDPRVPGVYRDKGLPRTFCAITQDGRDFGYYTPGVIDDGGLYDMRYTKIGWLGPHGRARTGMPAAADVTALSDLRGYTAPDDHEYQALITDIDGMFNGNSAFPECLPWLGVTHGAERQDGDEAHMHAGSPDGRQRLARIGMFYALKQLGLITTALPRLDQRYDLSDGSAAYFGIAGRDLTTERLWRVANGETLSNRSDGGDLPPDIIPALPNLAASHRTEVMGFSINNIPATDATIYTVLSSDTELLAAGFTAGQMVARVRPNAGSFSSADSIIYGVDRLPGYQVQEDYDDNVRAFLNWLVVDMGQTDLPRLPVQHQSLVLAQPSTLAAPAAFTIDGTTSWQSASDVASSATQMAFEVKGAVSKVAPDRFIQLGNSSAAKFELRGTGAIRARDTDANLVISDPAVAVNVGIHYRVQIDRSSGVLTLIDVLNDTTVTGSAGSGTFPGSALNIAPDGLQGSFERLAIWVGTAAPDWENDTPDFGIDAVGSGAGYVEYGGLSRTGPSPSS